MSLKSIEESRVQEIRSVGFLLPQDDSILKTLYKKRTRTFGKGLIVRVEVVVYRGVQTKREEESSEPIFGLQDKGLRIAYIVANRVRARPLCRKNFVTRVSHIGWKLSSKLKLLWIKAKIAKTIDKRPFLCYFKGAVWPCSDFAAGLQDNNMRFNRVILSGLFWWGCNASPDSLSIYPDSTSIPDPASVGDESEESDKRRGCGEEEDTGYFYNEPEGELCEVVWDTGIYDTGEVYLSQ